MFISNSITRLATGARRLHLPSKMLMALPLGIATAMLIPNIAYAGIIGDIENFFKEMFFGIGMKFWNGYYGSIGWTSETSLLTGLFSQIFGNAAPYAIVKNVHSTIIIPVGEAILALFMLVQLVKISQRIDATATLPAVKDIVFLAVTYVLMHWLIVNSLDIITAMYNIFNEIGKEFTAAVGQSTAPDISEWDKDKATVGGCIFFTIMGFFAMIAGFVTYCISLVVALARGIQIYALAAFSPIPLALMGFDETRQMGVGFLKNFAAAALAGAILLFLFQIYPYVMSAAGGNAAADTTIFSLTYDQDFVDIVQVVARSIAASILLAFACVRCNSWAKEILGS